MAWILRLDTALFTLLNGSLTSSALDVIMPFITDKSHFIALGAVLILLILLRGKKKEIRALIIVAVIILVSDFMAAHLKDVFGRIRPCHALTGVRLLAGCGGSYSFPSGHATNIFAAMVFLSLRYKKYWPFFIAVAVAIAYSRVYVGVHYPLDVLGGAILGSLVALSLNWLDKKGLHAIKKAIKH